MEITDLQQYQVPGIELKVAQAATYSAVDVVGVIKKYIFEEMNSTFFKQPHFSYQRSGATVHSEFLIRSRDNTLLGRIDYKDSKLMVPSMAIILKGGRTIVIVYKTERVSGYSKKRDWRNQKNVARLFEDKTGVLEQEVNISYERYLEQQKMEEAPFHRRRDEEKGLIMEALFSPRNTKLARGKKHFLRQKKP